MKKPEKHADAAFDAFFTLKFVALSHYEHAHEAFAEDAEVRSIHWFPYDRVRVVNAVSYGLLPASLCAHPTVSIPVLDAFQRQLTPFNSTPTFACIERP